MLRNCVLIGKFFSSLFQYIICRDIGSKLMLRLIALILVCTLLVLELVVHKPKKEERSEGRLFTANTGSSGHEPSLSSQTVSLDVGKRDAGNSWQEDSEYFASLGINAEQYDFSEPYIAANPEWEKEHGGASLLTLWRSDQPVDIEFTYQFDTDQERDVVELSLIQQDADDGQLYFSGLCKDKGVVRTFKVTNIVTKINYAGKMYSIEDFIVDRLSAELSAA